MTAKNKEQAHRELPVSIAAKGNPQICLLGGLLLFCLALIASLILIIVVAGLGAFRVRPIDLVQLKTGEVFLGQLQDKNRSESETNSNVHVESFQYRTSNPTLSGSEYQWISETELKKDNHTVQPELVMLIERFEIGRLYGIPAKLLLNVYADADALELADMCATLVDYSQSENSRFVLETQTADRLLHLASSEVEASISGQIEILVAEGALTDASDNQATENLKGMQTTSSARPTPFVFWTEPTQVVERLQNALAKLRQVRNRANTLRKIIANLDANISYLRLGIKRIDGQLLELDSNFVEDCQLRIGQLVRNRGKLKSFRKTRLSNFSSFDSLTDQPLVQAKNDFIEQVLIKDIEQLEFDQAFWRKKTEDLLPPEDAKILKSYASNFQRIESEKYPLQMELRQLDRILDQYQLDLAIPKSAIRHTATAGDIQLLDNSETSDELEAWLSEHTNLERVSSGQITPLHTDKNSTRVWQIHSSDDTNVLVSAFGISARETQHDLWLWSTQSVSVQDMARVTLPNQMSLFEKTIVYCDRWWEFLTTGPRLANTEGGVFPAILGMSALTLIMTIAVLPLGVMAALYLSEYTKSGALVSAIRVSINNLASVPSIIYGVFGFSFFCYTIGAFIDGGPQNASISTLPPTIWYIMLGLCALCATTAFFFGLNGPKDDGTGLQSGRTSRIALVIALIAIALLVVLVLRSPFFNGFYSERLPNPTFGKGGLLWAALTLALMNLPVVIVSTEEALAAVPNSLREGSYSCGASRWQTIWRIVLPYAKPGIVTGVVLAIARGTSVVAPLLLVGALPTVSGLPVDGQFPFIHGSRAFSHLGYWIFSLGAQNPNSDSTRTMVFASALLLLTVITALNLLAVYWRRRLRSKDMTNFAA